MKARVGLILLILITVLAPAGSISAQGEHLVLGFYYDWYAPNSFGPRKTSDQPITPYKSSDRATIERHVDEAKQAGLNGFIVSWYGPRDAPDNQTESNLRTLLDVAQQKDFKVAVDFETSGPFFKSKSDVMVIDPSAAFFNADQTFKSPEEITRMLNYVGIRRDQQVYSYCGGGVAASVREKSAHDMRSDSRTRSRASDPFWKTVSPMNAPVGDPNTWPVPDASTRASFIRPNTVSLVPIDTAMTPSRTSPVPIRLHGLSPDHAITRAAG